MRTTVLSLIFFFAISNLLYAQTHKVGDEVVVIKKVKLRSNGKNADTVSPGAVLKVKDVDSKNNLWVGNNEPGWLQPVNVIPLSSDAITRFNEWIAASPQDASLYNARGLVWSALKDKDKAIADYTEAIRLNPSGTGHYNNRGIAYANKNMHDEAIADYTSAISLNAEYSTGYYNRARAWRAKKDYEKALADYNVSIRLDPDSNLHRQGRGSLLHLQGNFDAAIEDFSACVRIDPKNAGAFQDRGEAYHAKGDFRKAISDYTKAINLNPTYETALKARGNALTAIGVYDQALTNYEKVLEIDPKDVIIYHYFAMTHLAMRDPLTFQDCDKILEKQGMTGSRSGYAIILGHLASKLIPKTKPKHDYLAISEGKLKDTWPTPVIEHFRGNLTETQLLELVDDDNQKQTQARCFLALLALANKDQQTALNHFQWVRDNGPKNIYEYTQALAELKTLETP